jgi:E3 ubiquitin-protein ligase RNF115/126
MPPTRRRSSSIVRSAATQIQKRIRGKQTRKKTNALMRDKRNLEITKRNLEIANRNSEIDNQCAICLAEVQSTDPVTSLPCGHRFHTECIQSWLQRGGRCPLCRGVIPTPTMTYEEALLARNRAQEERRLATQAYTNAVSRTNAYERSNRSRSQRRRGVNSPTYIRYLQAEETADAEVRRTQANVDRYMETIRQLS